MEFDLGVPLATAIGTHILPFSRPYVRKMINEGTLVAAKIGGKYFIDRESLNTLAKRSIVAPRVAA